MMHGRRVLVLDAERKGSEAKARICENKMF